MINALNPYNSQRASGSEAYNLAAGNIRLSEHFLLGEFACRDGSVAVVVHPVLVDMLESVRRHFGGRAVIINSGYRTGAHNRQIGGSTNSLHLFGLAADIVVRGVGPHAVAAYADEVLGAGGVGRYRTFTHVDVRAGHARWRG